MEAYTTLAVPCSYAGQFQKRTGRADPWAGPAAVPGRTGPVGGHIPDQEPAAGYLRHSVRPAWRAGDLYPGPCPDACWTVVLHFPADSPIIENGAALVSNLVRRRATRADDGICVMYH